MWLLSFEEFSYDIVEAIRNLQISKDCIAVVRIAVVLIGDSFILYRT